MWLLHTEDLTLHEFHGQKTPPYAILSHRWEEDEVTFRHLNDAFHFGRKDFIEYKGWLKIQQFANLAKTYGYTYCWVDTCCIDKSSSSELLEAINSMYKWYQNSALCFVYLSDVDQNYAKDKDGECIESSKWFTRSWTLQELLAPKQQQFFDQQWNPIGDKRALTPVISRVTRIEEEFLSDFNPREIDDGSANIAQKMSWASKREATREEDIAYSLIGLFDVNMPLFYGEGGERAFLRLQREIINQSYDETIFVHEPTTAVSGLLASSPAQFTNSLHVTAHELERAPYSLTHRGLQIELELLKAYAPNRRVPRFPYLVTSEGVNAEFAFVVFACGPRHRESDKFGTFLMKAPPPSKNIYVRVSKLHEGPWTINENNMSTVFVFQTTQDVFEDLSQGLFIPENS